MIVILQTVTKQKNSKIQKENNIDYRYSNSCKFLNKLHNENNENNILSIKRKNFVKAYFSFI